MLPASEGASLSFLGRNRLSSIVLGALIAGCAPAGTPTDPAGTLATPPLSIPATQLPPHLQCLVDHGIQLVEVEAPMFEGDSPGYQFVTDLPRAELRKIEEECDKLRPPPVPKTDAELRVIYDRWVKERECLVDLGYDPVEPPTFEKFLADWRSTGPWMPIDGVDTGSWSSGEYEAAKQACTLEMFDRD